jgi:hypothetical protein
LFCTTCGEPLSVADSSPEPRVTAGELERARAQQPRLVALLIAIVVTGIGSLMLLASATRAVDTPPPTTASPPIKPETSTATGEKDAASTYVEARSNVTRPRWTMTTALRRVGGQGIMFELAADEDVQIWRKRVRPVLTIRCVGRTTEVFVMTHTAANVEANTRLHTVQIGLDGQTPAAQMWEHSVDHDALFAPDAGTLVRQIAKARTMALTFTPFNASPAVAHFSVDGFAERFASEGMRCR